MQDYLVIILPLVWAVVIAFGIFVYVLLDGFDLGLGLLFLAAPSHAARDTMMRSVAPVWDGNETWLVLGGAALFAAFPLAYAVILPALYLPLVLMLIGLILRGVAFEFRFKADTSRFLWDWAFAGGSLLATAMQGLALGAFIQGFAVVDRHYAGGAFDWLTPFSILTAFALVAGYTLLACGWLIMKTEGALLDWAYAQAERALVTVMGFILVVSLWTPLQNDVVAARWFSWPNILMFSPVPIVTAAVVVALYRALRLRRVYLPFVLTAALFVLSYTGIAVSFFPYIIPPDITIWHAASPPETQSFLLIGLVPILPIILGYTVWNYYVFRGRVREGDGYH
jgi:cytochrome bd ubiquinol oxidase subunit II